MNKLEMKGVVALLKEQGFIELPTPSCKTDIKFASIGLSRMLDTDPLRSDFIIGEQRYPRDELGEPLELGLLDTKQGEKKEGTNLGVFDSAAGRTHNDAGKNRFHFADPLVSMLSVRAKSEYASFLRSAQRFNAIAKKLALSVADEFDRVNALLPVHERFPGSLRERLEHMFIITRLIRYHPLRAQIPDAQVHCDRSLFTVHHYSSASGLRVFDKAKQSHATDETNPETLCLFTGEKFRIATRGMFGPAAAHGVYDERRLGTAPTPEGGMRFVAVTFVHCALCAEDVAWFLQHKALFLLVQSEFVL